MCTLYVYFLYVSSVSSLIEIDYICVMGGWWVITYTLVARCRNGYSLFCNYYDLLTMIYLLWFTLLAIIMIYLANKLSLSLSRLSSRTVDPYGLKLSDRTFSANRFLGRIASIA